MRVSRPISIELPEYGVLFAESIHAADFEMAMRTDSCHKLIYVLAGHVTFRGGDRRQRVEAEAGRMLIVPRGLSHQISDQQSSTLLLLCLGNEFLEADEDLARLWLELARMPGRRLQLSNPERQRLEGTWRRAMAEQTYARMGSAVTVRAVAAQTLVLLARLPSEGTDGSAVERVAAIKREVAETFYDNWDLDRAAARAGLSRRRFTELFRSASGDTFWAFLNECRLVHAAKLLRESEHSIVGVIFSCGFNDVSHFYRLFRRRYGIAPLAWSKSVRDNPGA
jgi:AraC-like DNA-binding protein